MDSTSKVAILLATYNGEKYLSQQLDSILNQSYRDFACYIHDDGSTDKTVNILKSYKKDYPDKIFLVNGEPTGGARRNFYHLLRNVNAEYYMFCDQDDWWFPQKISVMISKIDEMERNYPEKPNYVFCDLEVVNEDLGLISESYMKYTGREDCDLSVTHLLFRNFSPGCASLINNKLKLLMLSAYNLDQTYMHDWWGLLVAACFGQTYYINEPLVKYRQHENNEMGAEKYLGFSKIKRLSKKGKLIKSNIEQAQVFCKLLLEIGNENEISIKELNDYKDSWDENKYRRAFYYFNNREHFTKFATFNFILFC